MRIGPVLAALSLVLASGCVESSRRDARNEAMLVIARYDAVRTASPETMEQRVGELSRVVVRDAEVRTVRDRCTRVYGAFVRARQLSDDARERFDRYAATPAASRSAEEGRALERMLTEANAAALVAQRGVSGCVDGIGRLRSRYEGGR